MGNVYEVSAKAKLEFTTDHGCWKCKCTYFERFFYSPATYYLRIPYSWLRCMTWQRWRWNIGKFQLCQPLLKFSLYHDAPTHMFFNSNRFFCSSEITPTVDLINDCFGPTHPGGGLNLISGKRGGHFNVIIRWQDVFRIAIMLFHKGFVFTTIQWPLKQTWRQLCIL